MKPSQQLVDFIKKREGFRSVAYKPLPTDRWTIGYGSTTIRNKPVVEGDVISEVEATLALMDKLSELVLDLSKPGLPLNLSSQQFDAVISLAYNIGASGFRNSDTGRLFYAGHDISNRFSLYNKSGGKVIPGLVARRKDEKNIYTNGVYT